MNKLHYMCPFHKWGGAVFAKDNEKSGNLSGSSL